MKEAISIVILLFFPILYKMVKDWNGTVHPNTKEVKNTFYVMLLCSGAVAFIMIDWQHYHRYQLTDLLKSLSVSLFGFMLFFPYLINWRDSYNFGYNPPRWLYILNHLSDTAKPDKYVWYRKLGWFGRALLWSLLFTLSILWFVW